MANSQTLRLLPPLARRRARLARSAILASVLLIPCASFASPSLEVEFVASGEQRMDCRLSLVDPGSIRALEITWPASAAQPPETSSLLRNAATRELGPSFAEQRGQMYLVYVFPPGGSSVPSIELCELRFALSEVPRITARAAYESGAELIPVVFRERSARPMASAFLSLHPNPASSEIELHYELTTGGTVRVRVFDPAGRAVRTLLHGPASAGSHRLSWNLLDEHQRRVPAGLYFAAIETNRGSSTRPLVVLPGGKNQ